MGAISAATLTHELSKSQSNHCHAIIFVPMDNRYMHAKVTPPPASNEQLGQFMNAIIATEYPQTGMGGIC